MIVEDCGYSVAVLAVLRALARHSIPSTSNTRLAGIIGYVTPPWSRFGAGACWPSNRAVDVCRRGLLKPMLDSLEFARVKQVRILKKMPVDKRHNAKIDYPVSAIVAGEKRVNPELDHSSIAAHRNGPTAARRRLESVLARTVSIAGLRHAHRQLLFVESVSCACV